MSKKISKPLAIAMGAALVGGLAATGAASADDNPFAMEELDSGYLMAGGHEEGGCGEGKCGDDKKGSEGSCGEDKGGEGKCGEGKCGGSA